MLLNTHDPISLGLPHRVVEITKRLFNDKRPFIILVAGSRRSGRSTTLSALARLHAANQVQTGEVGTRATLVSEFMHVTTGHALFTTTDEDDRQRLLTAQEDDWLREFSKRCVEALLDDTAIRSGLLINGTQGL